MTFPSKSHKTKEEEHYNKFCEWMKPLFLQIPLTDATKLPPYSKYMKDIDGGIPNRVGPDLRVGPQDPGGPAAHPEDHIRGRPSPQPGGPTRLKPGFGRRRRWRRRLRSK